MTVWRPLGSPSFKARMLLTANSLTNSIPHSNHQSKIQSTMTASERKSPKMMPLERLTTTMNEVANDGLDLSLLLRETLADQPATASLAHDLASSLSLFARSLRQLGSYLEVPSCPYTSTALETVDDTIDYTGGAFNKVDDMVAKFENDPTKDFRRCFRDSKVLGLIQRLESARGTVVVMLQVLQIRALMNLQE